MLPLQPGRLTLGRLPRDHLELQGLAPPRKTKEVLALEAALAAAREVPFPKNVTITIAAPVGSAPDAATLRLRRGVSLTAADSCLRILGAPPAAAAPPSAASGAVAAPLPRPPPPLRS